MAVGQNGAHGARVNRNVVLASILGIERATTRRLREMDVFV